MPSSSRHAHPARRGAPEGGKPFVAFAVALAVEFVCVRAHAQQVQQAQGFAVERLYPSAPGGGWVVMDALDMHGGLGGAIALTLGYAHDPLRVASADGSRHLEVVADGAFADFGLAVTYDRWRLYLNMDMPLAAGGRSDSVGGYSFAAPSVDLGSHPDTLSDPRLGVDARLFGSAVSPFRLGASAQVFFPNGSRADYLSDGTYRAMARLLCAGDAGLFSFAGQVGVHVRPLDDSPAPGSAQGSEMLFGVAGGPKLALARTGAALVVGPEIFGQTALQPFLGPRSAGVEGLLTARIESTGEDGAQIRIKLATGAGLHAQFGAPEWRVVFGLEVFDHGAQPRGSGTNHERTGQRALSDTPDPH